MDTFDVFPEQELKLMFPGLATTPFEIKSKRTSDYNCIAWVAGEDFRWWWPDAMNQKYWPDGVTRQATLEAFIEAFATLGYEPCASGDLEQTFEKIAIYIGASGMVSHAAFQLTDGRWASKLGLLHDIYHVLEGLAGHRGRSYGNVAQFLRRAKKVNK